MSEIVSSLLVISNGVYKKHYLFRMTIKGDVFEIRGCTV